MKQRDVGQAAYAGLQREIAEVVSSARVATARTVNALMTATYWEIGRRIVEFEQGGEGRAAYGEAVIRRLGAELSQRFGRGFGWRNLAQMRAFYLAWPADRIVQTLSAQSAPARIVSTASAKSTKKPLKAPAGTPLELNSIAQAFPLPWSAYVRLLTVKTQAARDFYEAEALREGWSVRQLDRQISSQLYERLMLSRNKASLLGKAAQALPGDLSAEEAIRDPFVLEFLDLKDEYSESDLEAALIQHLADFLLELGDDFAFIGRQRRLRIDDTWFRVDLVFFHRRLRCLLIIDLKVGRFSYADAGQMHLYLNYARENWMKPGENPPVGLILCAEKGAAEAHYALENLPNKILAAEYQMVLPDEATFARELERTRIELERRGRKT
ncbi:PDDEXK nuclease domain-containing protein [Burkholderia multivorans]|uniref:PDDEXK nuclease domain-containing protein n=1 Tax=Burkholderia multivorans TaxID=87883 RepID=UPI0020198EEF|nr:PDDEXK nuclease domain-containing protein [Burkholderia multivorans]MCA8142940.1 PDDEXK nuclease domain-containing protein [Burkholderia multivorans]MCO1368463.1 PDDEXK nuclease domain-containing protein [Burkholderia multivorans]MCO1380354.1 PDDEXK nuclease domain-containing protein [Burkholderia multivorans]MDN8028748.1 PDDEXK nuclease domain-containing protein [Burkholderia multivorans]UQP21529.1 PDDEXK nuclease domain-containing protein [Burkholderia multivorans]